MYLYVYLLQNVLGNAWTKHRYGKYIKVNSTGIKRRRKTLTRGSRMARQGRPQLWEWSNQSIPIRKVKGPKKPHHLAGNVLLNRRN